jgi:DNA-binding transcriptional regulator YiaG
MNVSLLNPPPAPVEIGMSVIELREICEALDLNWSQLARLLGVDQRSLRRWLSGEARITPIAARFLRLLAAIGISGAKAAELIEQRMHDPLNKARARRRKR